MDGKKEEEKARGKFFVSLPEGSWVGTVVKHATYI